MIELIGVLAVIGILAAVLVPRVFQAIDNARLATVPIALRTIKTATVEHFVRYNSLPTSHGAPLSFSKAYDGFDRVLVSEGFMDKPFAARVGTNCFVRLVNVTDLTPGSEPFDADQPGAYDLDGDGDNDIVGAAYLLEAVIQEPDRSDVAALNQMMDGPTMGVFANNGDDRKGRVVYRDKGNDPNPGSNSGARHRRAGTMYIHILHR